MTPKPTHEELELRLRELERETSERKWAEERLKASELKYRTLFESSPDAILMIDRDGVFDCNKAAVSIFDCRSKEDLLGKKASVDSLSTEHRDRNSFAAILDRIEKALRQRQTAFEWTFTKQGGSGDSPLHVEVKVTRFRYRGKKLALAVIRDMTERKRAEKEHQRLQLQFQQAQKMEAIGTLAGGIAHDFNNLLTGIQGSISLMNLDTPEGHPHKQYLRGMEDVVKQGVNLTKQLLGFAREGKFQELPTNINSLIKNTAEMFGRTKREIVIHEYYDKDLWIVEVDRGQIEQVLLNIFVNAWQAMPDGGELYIETKNKTIDEKLGHPFNVQSGRYVLISITDTGVGMDEETVRRVFDPFFTTKEKGKGTGLGLASAYGIIRSHGGFIDVSSKKGAGSTFYIYLPASKKEVVKEKEVAKIPLKGTETILLVDDEQMILKIGKKMLNAMDYTVLVASSGKEALEMYQKCGDQIDIVVLDMIMPGIGGGETYDRLKRLDPSVKVILASGYSLDGQAREIISRGCNGFIQKPFDVKKLTHKIREVLDLPLSR